MHNFNSSLKQLRRKYFTKQTVLAETCSCTTAYISWLENGKRIPSPKMVLKLSVAFKEAAATTNEIRILVRSARDLIADQRFAGLNF